MALKRTLGVYLCVLALAGCSDDSEGPKPDALIVADGGVDSLLPDGPVAHRALSLTVAHMGDTHAQLEPLSVNLKLAGTDTAVSLGGMSRLVAKVKALRASERHVLALHAGDVFQGTLYFTQYLGLADLEFLKLMELDAMVVGNHEFDRGPKVLADFVVAAKESFPVLGGNVDASGDADLAGQLEPYTIKEIEGEKVAILGLITPETSTISSPGNTVTFADHVQRARELVQEVEGMGINKVILLTHLGHDEDLRLAENVEGIDLIVGGHSHTLMGDEEALSVFQANPAYGGIPLEPASAYPQTATGPSGKAVCIVHGGHQTIALGVLKIEVDEDGFVTSCEGSPVMLVGDTFMRFNPTAGAVEEVVGSDKSDIVDEIEASPLIEILAGDPAALNLLGDDTEGYMKGVADLEAQKIADVTEDLVHVYIPGEHYISGVDYPHGSHLAPHVAASMLWKLKQHGIQAQIAVINAGGIKSDILQGDLSVGDVYVAMPFANSLVTIELSGQAIKDQLEQVVTAAHEFPSTGKRFPYPAGLRYTADMTQAEGQRITNLEVEDGVGAWSAVDVTATYVVCTVSFLAGGGDMYDEFKNAPGKRYDTGFIDAEAFVEYATHKATLAQPASTGVTYVPNT